MSKAPRCVYKVEYENENEWGVVCRLEGKVALVTGAASGIGAESVRLFASNGALVVAADVQDELGHGVVESIGSERVSYHHCDVRDEKEVEETVNYTLNKYGSLDVLFSNAGIIGPISSILELDIQGFHNTMATNVVGVASTIKHASRAMVARNIRGSIICTTSVSASLGGTGPHAYTTSKHALVGLVRSACSELGVHGIRVNSISPFGVATPLACRAFNLEPHEVEANSSAIANLKGIVLKATHIAEAALFLASDESAYISGHNLVVDGGFTVVNHSFASKL
nr:short-chain dehydrogenase reductase 3b-like [Ziziphus jujuba var. spinosa]